MPGFNWIERITSPWKKIYGKEFHSIYIIELLGLKGMP